MKTIRISVLTALVLSLSISFFGCASAAENKENAEDDVTAANEALEIANKEYEEDVENYRAEVKLSIDHNDSLINSHRVIMEKKGLTKNPFYKQEIENLEAQNDSLRIKIDTYKGEGGDNWNSFKEEFNHDMEELGNALKDLTVKNTK